MRRIFLAILICIMPTYALADAAECAKSFYAQEPKAYELCIPIAEKQEDAGVMKIVGDMYYWGWGDGLPKDFEQAILWYKRAAQKGDAEAKYNLGVLYEQGKGMPADFETAFKWYNSAAQDGHVGAQFNLANMYSKGAGVVQNQARASNWYLRAANQGDMDSAYNMGNRYATGNGIGQDAVEAYKWYVIAGDAGDGDAKTSMGHIAESMTPEQVSEAKVRAAKWSPVREEKKQQ